MSWGILGDANKELSKNMEYFNSFLSVYDASDSCYPKSLNTVRQINIVLQENLLQNGSVLDKCLQKYCGTSTVGFAYS